MLTQFSIRHSAPAGIDFCAHCLTSPPVARARDSPSVCPRTRRSCWRHSLSMCRASLFDLPRIHHLMCRARRREIQLSRLSIIRPRSMMQSSISAPPHCGQDSAYCRIRPAKWSSRSRDSPLLMSLGLPLRDQLYNRRGVDLSAFVRLSRLRAV